MQTLAEVVTRDSELRATLNQLHAERERELLSEKPNDNKLSGLRKRINETRDAISDVEILRRAAEQREAEKQRAVSAAEQRQRLDGAAKTLPPLYAAFIALQEAVENHAACYRTCVALGADAQRALRAAGLKDRPLLEALTPSLDLMTAVEMARAGIGHLAHVRMTGVADSLKIPEVMDRKIKKVREAIAAQLTAIEQQREAAA